MFANYKQIRQAARDISEARVAIPMGHDRSSIEALLTAAEAGLASAAIVAPRSGVEETLGQLGKSLHPDMEIIDCDNAEIAALEAVKLVSSGQATVLMKGLLKTSIFLKAVLDKEVGLRTGRILSHVAVVHAPRQDRLVAISDGGMNPYPNEEELVQIVKNAAEVITALGADRPRVALLAAIEVPNEKMPETLVARRIAEAGIEGMDIEGPLAVDGAVDVEAAELKNLHGPVAGCANVLIVPTIASGNIFAKGFMFMTDADVGGMIAGAAAPVVMLSRSDDAESKLNSLALGVVVSGGDANG